MDAPPSSDRVESDLVEGPDQRGELDRQDDQTSETSTSLDAPPKDGLEEATSDEPEEDGKAALDGGTEYAAEKRSSMDLRGDDAQDRDQADHSDAARSPARSESEAAPADLTLSPSLYPNPFAEATTLRFYLAEETTVQVAVYDLAGRRVALVHDGRLPPGWQALPVHLDGAPRGTYVWHIQTHTQAKSGRLTRLW